MTTQQPAKGQGANACKMGLFLCPSLRWAFSFYTLMDFTREYKNGKYQHTKQTYAKAGFKSV